MLAAEQITKEAEQLDAKDLTSSKSVDPDELPEAKKKEIAKSIIKKKAKEQAAKQQQQMIEEEMAKLKADNQEKITKKAQLAEQQAKMI